MSWKTAGRNLDLKDKIIDIRRVMKSCQGGKIFSFSVLVVIGDNKGRVGCGKGKSREISDAVRKASENARLSLVRVPIKEGRTLYHDVESEFGSAKVIIRAAKPGRGIIAGRSMRGLLSVAGYSDVVAKSIGSSCPHNVVFATLFALRSQLTTKSISDRKSAYLS